MTKGKVRAYARVSTGYLRGVEVDHVFLVSEQGHNWNCFGGGKEELENPAIKDQVRCIGETSGNIEWMARAYVGEGNYAGSAANVFNLFSGVCQSAANRILAMGDGDVSVNKAKMNELAVLLFGKYGFDVDAFVLKIERIAGEMNARSPGSVSSEELKKVKDKFARGKTVEAEMELLTDDAPQTLARIREKCTEGQITAFLREYSAIQAKREDEFMRIEKSSIGRSDVRKRLLDSISVDAVGLLTKVSFLIGDIPFRELFKCTPQQAWELMKSIR